MAFEDQMMWCSVGKLSQEQYGQSGSQSWPLSGSSLILPTLSCVRSQGPLSVKPTLSMAVLRLPFHPLFASGHARRDQFVSRIWSGPWDKCWRRPYPSSNCAPWWFWEAARSTEWANGERFWLIGKIHWPSAALSYQTPATVGTVMRANLFCFSMPPGRHLHLWVLPSFGPGGPWRTCQFLCPQLSVSAQASYWNQVCMWHPEG